MGGKSGSQTTTQSLPPEVKRLLGTFSNEVGGVASGSSPDDFTQPLSGDTLQGLDFLRNQFTDNAGADLISQTVGGDFLNSNPFVKGNTTAFNKNTAVGLDRTGAQKNQAAWLPGRGLAMNAFDGVSDAITQQAKRVVGDRFSQAGRSGNDVDSAEGLALGGEIARQLAPYGFGAQEAQLGRRFQDGQNQNDRRFGAEENRINRMVDASQNRIDRSFGANENRLNRTTNATENYLNRGFGNYGNERSMQQNAINQLFGMLGQNAQNYMNVGGVLENQANEEAMAPFNRLNALAGPIGTVLSGSPMSQTTTGSGGSNRFGSALGGALGGASLGAMKGSIGGPWGAALGGLGGLLFG